MKRLIGPALAVVLLVGAGLIVWRVLRPAEVLDRATGPYPAAAAPRAPGVTGRVAWAPLIVDGRIRVFAAERQVRADAPVSARTTYTPRWSFRRWPEQLSGVVAIGTTVVSRWSDGELVAIDGRTGDIAWRAAGPVAGGFSDSSRAVWTPGGLFTAGTTVLSAGAGRVAAVDVATGSVRWTAAADGCGFTTTGGSLICAGASFDAAGGARTGRSGTATPLGCGVARSGCGGFRDANGQGWLATGPEPVRAPTVDAPDGTVAVVERRTAAGTALSAFALSQGAAVVARSPLADASEAWRWAPPAGQTVRVLGTSSDAVHLLTSAGDLVTVEPSGGTVRSVVPLGIGSPLGWQVTDTYVAVESAESTVLAAA